MELKLVNGRYVSGETGGLCHVEGHEEKLQRILCRLSARRGGFFPMPDFGSRLHSLCSLKPSARAAAAQQFVHEALEDEDVEIVSVSYTPGEGDSGSVDVELSLGVESGALTLNV